MKSINEVTLLGNLARDPELKYVGDNNPLCRVTIATSQSYKDKNDEWQEVSQFNDVTFWGRAAEKIAQTVFKGDKLLIKGTVENTKWTDKNGETKYGVQIKGKDFITFQPRQSAVDTEEGTTAKEEVSPDEIPF